MSGSAAPILIAFVALGLSAFAFLDRSPSRPDGAGELDSSVAALEARLEQLEQKLSAATEQLDANAADLSVTDAATSGRSAARPSHSAAIDELRSTMKMLDARMKKLEAASSSSNANDVRAERDKFERMLRERRVEERAAKIPEFQAKAMSIASSEEERLRALGHLRGMSGGRDAAVVASMIQLARTSQNGEIRADIWRQMSGAKDPQLVPPMLDALRSDTHNKAREEAAETLGDFNDRADVRAALEHASKHDADEDVREEAANSLRRKPRR